MNGCGPAESHGFITSVVRFVDCQADGLGTGSWLALARPGSTLSVLLSVFLTLFIAIIGYNLLLGRSITVRTGVLAFVKMGMVLALATSWPAYRTLVYDLVTDGPGALVKEIGPSAQVRGSDGSLLQRLDLADDALAQLAVLGSGNPPADFALTSGQFIVPPPFANFNAFALGSSRILFLVTAIGGLVSVRLLIGLLLALGPFFVAFLLFDNSRSLFEGWLRILSGAALASLAISIVLGLQLALIEPWLLDVLVRRQAGEPLPSMPTELFVLMAISTLALTITASGAIRIMRAFRLAPLVSLVDNIVIGGSHSSEVQQHSVQRSSQEQGDRSRADRIADVVSQEQRRRALTSHSLGQGNDRTGTVGSSITSTAASRQTIGEQAVTVLGRSHRRQVRPRSTASSGRRDQRR